MENRMLLKYLITLSIVFITILMQNTFVLAENQLSSEWQSTEFSNARAHILYVDKNEINIGVEIDIVEKYKTYWQAPGNTGVPAFVTATGNNIAPNTAKLIYPMPKKFINKYGETWGYKDRVVIFIKLYRVDDTLNTDIKLNFDYAVCDLICLPVHAEFDLNISAGKILKTLSNLKFSKFKYQIPTQIEFKDSVIKSAKLVSEKQLHLTFKKPVDGDVFIIDDQNRFYQLATKGVDDRYYNVFGVLDHVTKNIPIRIYYTQQKENHFIILKLTN